MAIVAFLLSLGLEPVAQCLDWKEKKRDTGFAFFGVLAKADEGLGRSYCSHIPRGLDHRTNPMSPDSGVRETQSIPLSHD